MRALALLALLLVLPGCVAPAAPAPTAGHDAAALSCPAPCAVAIVKDLDGAREPIVAADPRDPSHLLVASMWMAVTGDAAGRLQVRLDASRDGGASWAEQPFDLTGPPDTETYDPALAILPDGAPVVGVVSLPGAYTPLGMAQGEARVVAARLGSEPMTLAQGQGIEGSLLAAGLVAPDKPALAASPSGALLAAWTVRERATPLDAGSARVALALSKDGGASWSALPAPRLGDNVVAGQPIAFGRDWAVPYVAMPTPDAFAKREFHCGVALVEAALARDLGPCGWVPALAAHGGTLAAAVTVAAPQGPSTELRLSSDAGATWDAIRLDAPEAKGESVPSLVASGDAWIATFFHPTSANATSLRAVAVRDGVASAPVVLDARIARQPAQVGDYFGLVAVPGGAYATWVGVPQDARSVMGARLVLGG